MSYCRWSSDYGNYDLCCYESDFGFITHVAGYRQRIWVRVFHWLTDKRVKLDNRIAIRMTRIYLNDLPHWMTHKTIGLKYDGEQFNDETEKDFYETLKTLHEAGYRFPKHLLEEAKKV